MTKIPAERRRGGKEGFGSVRLAVEDDEDFGQRIREKSLDGLRGRRDLTSTSKPSLFTLASTGSREGLIRDTLSISRAEERTGKGLTVVISDAESSLLDG